MGNTQGGEEGSECMGNVRYAMEEVSKDSMDQKKKKAPGGLRMLRRTHIISPLSAYVHGLTIHRHRRLPHPRVGY